MQMEPVLLVNCPRELSPHLQESTDKRMPLGLLYIAAVLKANGVECRVLDAEACRLGISEILDAANQLKPALIGLNCHTLNRWTVYEIARSLKIVLPRVKIMLGGSHPSLAPVSTLSECPEVDAIALGESEMTCLNVVRSNGDLDTVRGLYLQKAGRAVATGRQPRIPLLDALPYPDLSDVPIQEYLGYEDVDLPGLWRRAYIAATRGCQYRCSFCTEWSFWSAENTSRSAGSIIDEIKMYRSDYGVNHFYFYDDTFTDWPDFREFCESAQSLNVEWSCSTRIDHLTSEVIDTLSQGGCREIAVGLESGSAATLHSLNKEWPDRISHDRVGSAIARCRDAGIRMRAHFMLGFPWESKEDITATVEFAIAMKDAGLADVNFFTVKVYPGTTFAGRLMRQSPPDTDLTEAWSVHDADLTKDPRVAAKLRRFNDIARHSLHPHLDSLSVRALARRAWEIFFGDVREGEVAGCLWDGVAWRE
jgi:anaerobic magnesium-protoporphyrin IX monomethyl ester cyclase